MSQHDQHGDRPESGSLPDFAAHSSPDGEGGLPAYDHATGPATLGPPSEGAQRRTLAVTLTVVGAGVVLLAVIALVLSQTVFRSVLADPDPSAHPTGDRTAEGQSEYVPDPDDPELAPPPPIFTQAPTTDCTIPDSPESAASPSGGDAIRGGNLEYTIPDGWGVGWGAGSIPYLDQVGAEGRNIEGSWYSVVNLGRVVWPEDEGGYPGLETSAVALFQCYATTAGVMSHFGEHPVVTDYRSEATTVDGSAAWIVQATYHFEDPEILETSSASIVTSIVVETPSGPSALVSDVAADQPEHVQNLEDIIASLVVVD